MLPCIFLSFSKGSGIRKFIFNNLICVIIIPFQNIGPCSITINNTLPFLGTSVTSAAADIHRVNSGEGGDGGVILAGAEVVFVEAVGGEQFLAAELVGLAGGGCAEVGDYCAVGDREARFAERIRRYR